MIRAVDIFLFAVSIIAIILAIGLGWEWFMGVLLP